ncbi:hypothetical protein BH10PSE17_BH10PSE17_04230 [soil metagenome]
MKNGLRMQAILAKARSGEDSVTFRDPGNRLQAIAFPILA